MINEIIIKIGKKIDLTQREMQQAMEEVMSGKAGTAEIVSFLTALSVKGETVDELTSAAKVMRKYATQIKARHKVVLDTCGTGGDAKGTFNISTTAAFVVAGCGVAVAKHGNRSVSSLCGSADVLEALGVDVNMHREKIEKCLNEIGLAFLFAVNLHPAMKYAVAARKEIAKRTMFNILGPLTNPAGARYQLVGVYDKELANTMAGVLANMGSIHALVVHGQDGLDEITTTSKTYICETHQGKIKNYEITPEEFGIKKANLGDLSGGSVEDNKRIMLDVLNAKTGPARDIVILNAAAALYAADKVRSIKEGIDIARKAIDTKKALEKLELLQEYSK